MTEMCQKQWAGGGGGGGGGGWGGWGWWWWVEAGGEAQCSAVQCSVTWRTSVGSRASMKKIHFCLWLMRYSFDSPTQPSPLLFLSSAKKTTGRDVQSTMHDLTLMGFCTGRPEPWLLGKELAWNNLPPPGRGITLVQEEALHYSIATATAPLQYNKKEREAGGEEIIISKQFLWMPENIFPWQRLLMVPTASLRKGNVPSAQLGHVTGNTLQRRFSSFLSWTRKPNSCLVA